MQVANPCFRFEAEASRPHPMLPTAKTMSQHNRYVFVSSGVCEGKAQQALHTVRCHVLCSTDANSTLSLHKHNAEL